MTRARNVAHGVDHRGAAARVERGHAAAEERPREGHVPRAVAGDEPERGAHDLVLGAAADGSGRGSDRADRRARRARRCTPRPARRRRARPGRTDGCWRGPGRPRPDRARSHRAARPACGRPRGAWPPPPDGTTGRAWRPCRATPTPGRSGSAAPCSPSVPGRRSRHGGSTYGRAASSVALAWREVSRRSHAMSVSGFQWKALAWLYSSRSAGHLRRELERKAALDEPLLLRLVRAQQPRRVLAGLAHRVGLVMILQGRPVRGTVAAGFGL